MSKTRREIQHQPTLPRRHARASKAAAGRSPVRRDEFRRGAKRNFTGTAGQQRVPTTFLADAEIPLPPLPEQRRIIDLLSRAEGIVRLRREAQATAQAIIPALFLDMFGDPATNSECWPVAVIGDALDVKGGKRLPKGTAYSDAPTPFRYIRGTDISPNQIDTSSVQYLLPEAQASIKRYVVRAGDVVMTIAGKIGVAAPVDQALEGANLTENAAMLRAKGAVQWTPGFLAHQINSAFVQTQIASLTGRVTIGKLALERIRTISLIDPPIDVQHCFDERLRAILAIVAQQSEALKKADSTLQSLLAREFSVGRASMKTQASHAALRPEQA